MGWIDDYCEQNQEFIRVPEDYICIEMEDGSRQINDFTLFGLDKIIPCFDQVWSYILDLPIPPIKFYPNRDLIVEYAPILYGFIHGRFIVTSRGISRMQQKYEVAKWGACPSCKGVIVPVGEDYIWTSGEEIRRSPLKYLCCSCGRVRTSVELGKRNVPTVFFSESWLKLWQLEYGKRNNVRSMRGLCQSDFHIYGFRLSANS